MAGIIPTGMWVMNEATSRKLSPASLTLWVIRDDGRQLIWTSVETDPQGKVSVHAFDGEYGGAPTTVLGNGFVVSLTNPGPRQVEVTGDLPGMGPLSERTEISEDGKQMIVHGEVGTGDDKRSWYEEFNWRAPSPHND